ASSCIGIGNWYRQLVGESLGKTYNIANQEIYAGITPTVSVGSTDLHSVGQLYLGGPRDKLFCFFELETVEHGPRVPQMPQFDSCITNIQGVAFLHIMHAIMQGVQQAYANDRRPFFSIRVPEMSAYYCGYLLQL